MNQKVLQKQVAIFIPCYNEARRIRIDTFQKFIQGNATVIDFYFVDDGSKDATGEIISQNLVSQSNCFLISHPKNLGKGNALREAYLKVAHNEYSFFGFIDADLDIPLEHLLKLYSTLENSQFKVAITQRALYKNFSIGRLRSVSSVVMVTLANKMIGFTPKLGDTQCGCKLFSREMMEVGFNQPFHSEWLFDVEIFLRLRNELKNARETICEVPLEKLGKPTQSNFRFLENLKIIKQLYVIKRYYN